MIPSALCDSAPRGAEFCRKAAKWPKICDFGGISADLRVVGEARGWVGCGAEALSLCVIGAGGSGGVVGSEEIK
jgi:hypothetical protein